LSGLALMQLAMRLDVGLKGDTPSSAMEVSRSSRLDQSGDQSASPSARVARRLSAWRESSAPTARDVIACRSLRTMVGTAIACRIWRSYIRARHEGLRTKRRARNTFPNRSSITRQARRQRRYARRMDEMDDRSRAVAV
jgi:hypothetical protein